MVAIQNVKMDAKAVLEATSAFGVKISVLICTVYQSVPKEPTRLSITLVIDVTESAKLVMVKVGKKSFKLY